ncbi:unnamed protein product [Cyprideis torosa]|uniref:2-amino-3-carboxymuconate-6-semialdehyde decarboxylase n=1 Tax=Cyprideis torosa TaxID=163714 RepID=A0A7R8ZXY3_9CRUS|nr:unnamed protein product [Cyprideis torosa]CAG0907541.1 unnamed protein product [Cyprideis torosa]
MSKLFTIDIHTHILPENIPNFKEKFGYGGFINLDHHKPCCARMMKDDTFFREVQDNCWDAETRMRECGEQHVDVQIGTHIDVHNPEDMQKPGHRNLDAPEVFQVLEACEKLDMAVFIHPWDMIAKEKMQKYWLPWLVGMPAESSLALCSLIFSGTFEKLPKLRVAVAHGGGSFPATLARIQHGFDVRPDLCAIDNTVSPTKTMGKFWLDSLVHDPKMLQYIVDLVGADRVALGTDYPFPLGELEPGKLINGMPWKDEQKEMLLSGSALEWLNLNRSYFE